MEPAEDGPQGANAAVERLGVAGTSGCSIALLDIPLGVNVPLPYFVLKSRAIRLLTSAGPLAGGNIPVSLSSVSR